MHTYAFLKYGGWVSGVDVLRGKGAIHFLICLIFGLLANSSFALPEIEVGAFSQCYIFTQKPQDTTSPDLNLPKKPIKLSLRDAIMLALRCNPTIVNAELDRISQKFNLIVADHQFEWQPS